MEATIVKTHSKKEILCGSSTDPVYTKVSQEFNTKRIRNTVNEFIKNITKSISERDKEQLSLSLKRLCNDNTKYSGTFQQNTEVYSIM
jgi:hypothetical protein